MSKYDEMTTKQGGQAKDWTFQHIGGFSVALDYLEHKRGTKVSREGWNGKGMWISVKYPEGGSHITEPFIYMKTAQGGFIPWLASQADLLAKDWMIVND